MKLHKLISTLFCSLILLASCEDYDFKTDDSYNKLFRTPKVTIEDLDATYIDLSWSKVPSADYYILELSKDELEFTTELQTFGADKSIKTSAYKIENLLGATQYSVRIKAVSDKGIPESEYAAVTFKTKAEQILNEVSSITGTNAVISWNPAATFDRILITTGTGENPTVVVDRAPTTEELAAGQIKLTNLTPATSYTVSVTLNGLPKGQRNFSTTENFPEGYTVVTLQENELLENALATHTGNVVIVFPLGSDFKQNENTQNTIPATITSIYFWGASGGERVKFCPKGLNVEGSLDILKFYNLDLYNNTSSSDYVLSQSTGGASINTFSIENCTVKDTRGICRIRASAPCTIKNVEIKNSVFTNIGSYAIVATKENNGNIIENITIEKSTFNNITANSMFVLKCNDTTINIEECTFFNFGAKDKAFFDINNMTGVNAYIRNCIIAKTKAEAVRPWSVKNGSPTCENSYCLQDCITNSLYGSLGSEYPKTSDDFFENANEGNFKIKDPSFPAGIGDPRWTE